ncbi:MAG: type II secretion system F family protein [Alphaproteobacteria bacterium]
MPVFEYRAVAPDGEVTDGEMEASDRAEVIQRLQASDYLPIRADPKGAAPARASGLWAMLTQPIGQRHGLGGRPLARFARQLAGLLDAGLTVEQALTVLRGAEDARLAATAERLLGQVRGGQALSQAAERAGFPALFVALLRAGETGGDLAGATDRIARYLERARAAVEQVQSALIYPVILVVVAALSVAVLMVAVIPEFEQMFRQAGQALPWPTAVLVAIADAVDAAGWLLPIVLLGGWLALRMALTKPGPRRSLHAAWLRLPVIGRLARWIAAERFARALGALLGGGVPLPRAVELGAEAAGNQAVADHLDNAARALRQGETLADAAGGDLLPRSMVDLLRVGEATGRLGPLAEQAADMQAAEIDAAVRRLIAVLVPALTLALGALVGGIILSVLAAVLGLNELVL